jgi:hypothetical protein
MVEDLMSTAVHPAAASVPTSDTYRVHAERDGKFWFVTVPAVDRSTQARHLREIEQMARDLIRVVRDLTDEQTAALVLNIDIGVPPVAATLLTRARQLSADADRLRRESAIALREAASALHADGMPVRDIGGVLGVSHQRAHQLINQELVPMEITATGRVPTYRAVLTRAGDHWLAEVPGLPGAHANAHSLTALRAELIDTVVLAADLPDDAHPDVRLGIAPGVADPVMLRAREAFALADLRAEIGVDRPPLAELIATHAQRLRVEGWSAEDIAGALGVAADEAERLIH